MYILHMYYYMYMFKSDLVYEYSTTALLLPKKKRVLVDQW